MKLEELGRRAVARKHWRWMPGMLMHDGGWGIRYLWSDDTWHHGVARDGQSWVRIPHGRLFEPDLSDPATLGCLLHLVREAHGDGDTVAFVAHSDGSPKKWCVDVGVDQDFFDERKYVYGPTEAEALVVALEAAP